jgi:branched-chain amino acid transport system permease protein
VNLIKNPRVRQIGLTVIAAGVTVLLTQVVFPGSEGGGRGTPMALLFAGLVTGALTAMSAIGLVLIYRTSRVVNFAQAALGAAGAIFAYNLIIVYNVPYAIAFIAGVGFAAIIGFATEMFLRRFFDAPRLVVTIVTIGLAALVGGFAVGAISSFPFWGEERDLVETFGGRAVVPFESFDFTIGDVELPFRFSHLLTLGILVVVILGVGWFLKYTRLGTAVRASSENAERAELLGVNVRILSTIVWTIAGAISGASLILLGTTQSFAIGGRGAPSVLIPALAAAVVARMSSIPVAVYASLLIGILDSAAGWSFRDAEAAIQGALFLVILAGLLAQRRVLRRAEEASSWEANQEVRSAPRELLSVPSIRNWRLALVVGFGIFLLVFPWTVESGLTNRASLAAIFAIALLSLVVLTGWAGQVSLGQFAFVAIGAVVGAALTSKASVPFWVALPIAAVICAAIAIAVGLPALRIRGLFLGVVTLAFASAVSLVLFDERYFGWLQPEDIKRPTLFLVDFEDERSMYYLCVLFLALIVAMIVFLRRSRPGRVLIALRENENDIQAFGINVVRTKLSAFALSGFICGLAGVLFVHHQRALSDTAFSPQASIDLFVYAIIGGVGSVTGAMLGSGFQAVVDLFPVSDPTVAFFLNSNFGLLVILYLAPGGISSIVYTLRDSIYRIVAQRRQMVVPSLMADFDPTILERQLIPLGETSTDSGLAAVGAGPRYTMDSKLYRRQELDSTLRAPDDRAALGAAAERVSGES